MVFFIQYCYVMLLWSDSIWKQYNTGYTCEENEGKKVLIFLLMWKGGRATPGKMTTAVEAVD